MAKIDDDRKRALAWRLRLTGRVVTVIIFVAVAFAVGYAIWHFEHPPEPSHSGRHRSRYYREEGLQE